MNDVLWMIKFNIRSLRSPPALFHSLDYYHIAANTWYTYWLCFASDWRHFKTNTRCMSLIKTYTDTWTLSVRKNVHIKTLRMHFSNYTEETVQIQIPVNPLQSKFKFYVVIQLK